MRVCQFHHARASRGFFRTAPAPAHRVQITRCRDFFQRFFPAGVASAIRRPAEASKARWPGGSGSTPKQLCTGFAGRVASRVPGPERLRGRFCLAAGSSLCGRWVSRLGVEGVRVEGRCRDFGLRFPERFSKPRHPPHRGEELVNQVVARVQEPRHHLASMVRGDGASPRAFSRVSGTADSRLFLPVGQTDWRIVPHLRASCVMRYR